MNIQYAELKKAFAGASYFRDCSAALDGLVESAYVDWMHLSWNGNDRMGAVIARIVNETI